MALLDGFLKKKYTATVYCNNCNSHSEVHVPKGVTVNQFIENGPCPSCGCATLIADYKQIDEFKDRRPQPKMQILRPKITIPEPRQRAPLPEPRPSMKEKRYQPLPPPTDDLPDFSIPKDYPVDFWTGERNERRSERRKRRGDINENY